MVDFRVGVDSGVIQISRNPNHLEAGGNLYGKIQDLALWTAAAVWDGRKGAIGTPHGDGRFRVVYNPHTPYDWRYEQDKKGGFLVNLPRPPEHKQDWSTRQKPGKPFTLYLGDVGQVQGQIEFPEHHLIAFHWNDDTTLIFTTD